MSYEIDTDFAKFWLEELTSKQRGKRLEKAIVPIKTVGRKQISILNKYEKADVEKDVGFLYFISTVKNVWENIEFTVELGKGRYKRFSFYPTRCVLENLLRLEHFYYQKKDERNDIAIRELLRITKRFYDREKIDNSTGESYKAKYDELVAISGGAYPNIEKANSKDDPFPNIKNLTEKSCVPDGRNLYFLYGALCELSHGKLLANISSEQDDSSEHIRSLMGVYSFACNLIKLVDLHIGKATAVDVTDALKASEAIIKEGMIIKHTPTGQPVGMA